LDKDKVGHRGVLHDHRCPLPQGTSEAAISVTSGLARFIASDVPANAHSGGAKPPKRKKQPIGVFGFKDKVIHLLLTS
jgi:hypothetical protein